MNIERPTLKRQAREIIRLSQPSVLYAGAIYAVLIAVLGYLSARIAGPTSYEQFSRYAQYMQEGSYYHAMDVLERLYPSSTAQLISTALEVMEIFVGVGFTAFWYTTLRGLGASYGNLLDGFGPYIRLVLLRLVIGIFIALWSMLLLIPGVIAAYRYSMASFVMLDHPEYSIMECIRESARMMRGFKGRLFLLDLSMLGWLLLSYVPILGYAVLAWYRPYHDLCYLLFYDQLRLGTQETVYFT